MINFDGVDAKNSMNMFSELVVSESASQRTVMFDNWMMCVSDFLDDSIETVDFVRCIVDDTFCTIRFNQTITSFHLVTMTRFPCLFIVAGVQILDGITELIVGWCLFRMRRMNYDDLASKFYSKQFNIQLILQTIWYKSIKIKWANVSKKWNKMFALIEPFKWIKRSLISISQ